MHTVGDRAVASKLKCETESPQGLVGPHPQASASVGLGGAWKLAKECRPGVAEEPSETNWRRNKLVELQPNHIRN